MSVFNLALSALFCVGNVRGDIGSLVARLEDSAVRDVVGTMWAEFQIQIEAERKGGAPGWAA
jgi:hypothetical protein